jgi:Transposase zinc-binding domain
LAAPSTCRNRHCPQCGARAKDAWLQGRLAEVLEVPYAHLVFTLPHELNSLYRGNPKWVIQTLFATVAQTLQDFAANPRWMGVANGQAAFSLVLHTWSQDLRQHLHLP